MTVPDVFMLGLLFQRRSGTEPQNPTEIIEGEAAIPKPHLNPLAR
jgi:hypothetical protein